MDYKKYINEDNNTITDLSEFICDNGVSEYQVMIHITQPNLTYQEQLAGILNTFTNLLTGELKGAHCRIQTLFPQRCRQSSGYAAGIDNRIFRLCPLRCGTTPSQRYQNRTVGLSANQRTNACTAQWTI